MEPALRLRLPDGNAFASPERSHDPRVDIPEREALEAASYLPASCRFE
jgi:hypothetical protein